jgi:ATP-dependent RNA helicase MSS116
MDPSDLSAGNAQPWSSMKGKLHDSLLRGLQVMKYE